VNAGQRIIHVRINDAETGHATPARIQFKGPSAEYLPPLGRLAHFALGVNEDVGGNLLLDGDPYAYVDGSFEIPLPPDPVSVFISKGPEYRSLHTTTQVGPCKMALRFVLERWIDLRHQGWYSGDSRAHFLSPHAALLEAAAEDLAVVNLLALETDEPRPNISNIISFSGQGPALERSGHLVVVNTMNQHATGGRLGLLNCHRIVFPLSAGGRWGSDHWTLADWCNQCHRKGGLVVWCGGGQDDHPTDGPTLADAYEVTALDPESLSDWYTLLGAGQRKPLIGASGKCSNTQVLGNLRTYAQLNPGEEFSYKNWIEAVRAGRTFVTKGPLITFRVNDSGPGRVITPSERSVVHLHAEAQSATQFANLQILANGKVVKQASAGGSPCSAVVDADVDLPGGGWIAASCPGAAHSSPAYVEATSANGE
jgi:hypothetical protein